MSVQNSAPPAPFGQPDVRTADVDFDKRTDIIQSLDVGGATSYRIWFNLGEQAYSPAITVEPSAAFGFSIPGVQIADCNGDRVPDIIAFSRTAWWLLPDSVTGVSPSRKPSPCPTKR
jgi:hypothetical protein